MESGGTYLIKPIRKKEGLQAWGNVSDVTVQLNIGGWKAIARTGKWNAETILAGCLQFFLDMFEIKSCVTFFGCL